MVEVHLPTQSDPRNSPYRPYGAAESLFKTQAREVLMVGPSGTGKTRAVLEKVYLAAMKYPFMRALLVRATRASMTESVLVTLENKVLPEDSGLCEGSGRGTRARYRLANGSEIVVLGLDNVNRIMSAEYDMIGVFEATETKEDDWEKLDTRMRNARMPYAQMIADCNPGAPAHWLRRRANAGKMHELFSMHADNPTCSKEYLASLARLTGHRRARLFEGRWAAPEGIVYPNLLSCVIEPMTEIPDGRLIGGLDFGWHDPFVALGGVYLEDIDTIYVYYERYLRHVPITTHAERLREFERCCWYCDPSRPDSIRDLRLSNVWVRPASNNILAGVDAVSTRIEQRRLLISNECTALIAESQGYVYDPDKQGEKPEPGSDHTMDALRYMVMGIDRYRAGKRNGEPNADADGSRDPDEAPREGPAAGQDAASSN